MASKPATSTPGPWEILIGGNFVRIGSKGYLEWVEKNHYLAGPLCVAEAEYHATDDFKPNPELALANARLIALAPMLPELVEALEDTVRLCEHVDATANLKLDWPKALLARYHEQEKANG